MTDKTEDSGKFRRVPGFLGWLVKTMLVAIPVSGVLFILDVHISLGLTLHKEQFLALFFSLVLGSVYIKVPATRKTAQDHIPFYDLILAVLGFGSCFYAAVVYPRYLLSGPLYMGQETAILGILAVVLVAEATRRMIGWPMVLFMMFLVFYALLNHHFPPPFSGKGISLSRLSVYVFLDHSGLLGGPAWVVGSIIFGFILLGRFLFAVGGGQFLNDFSLATMGRFRGGAAKMAILGSSLFGTISGSAVANVTATGVMTIPMMKKSGYRAEIAAAIESVASTGGQLLPPVMGVTAFILAEILGVSYTKVAFAALLPAVLFYFVLFVNADLEAAKHGMRGLSEGLPSFGSVLKRGWTFVAPLVVLVYTIFVLNFHPGKASLVAVATVFALGLLRKETRIGWAELINILEMTGKGLLEIGAICGTAGVVIGLIYVSGLGTTISHLLLKAGAENLFLLFVYSAIVSIILGMGMPTAPVYIILAVLIAPAIVSHGVPPIAAHLFIFYFGVVSMITPPVCIASFAGAAVAGANPMSTGWHAFRFGITAFIVPFTFVYSPALLMQGSIQEAILVTLKSGLGLSFLTIGFSGFLFSRLNAPKRILFCLGAVGMLIPYGVGMRTVAPWALNIAGLILCVAMFFRERGRRGTIPASVRSSSTRAVNSSDPEPL